MKNLLNVIAINVCGIECSGRLEEIRLLLVKYGVDVAILSETETSHSLAATTNLEGYKAFCPQNSVTGPPGKEAGVIVLVSEKLASSCKLRPDINGLDTVQTVWIEFTNYDILIGGVYWCNRSSDIDLEKYECSQLNNQVLKATQSGKAILLMGDTNMDHTNPCHRRSNEAKDLLTIIEAANMRRLPTGPTWKSFCLHKVCPCDPKATRGCPKRHKVSTIDNAFLSLSETGTIKVLAESISDHSPILATLTIQTKGNDAKLKTVWRRDITRLKASILEDALKDKEWSHLFEVNDPNKAVSSLNERVTEALDEVAPFKQIKFRPDKPELNLKSDNLTVMSSRDKARKDGNHKRYKQLRNLTKSLIKRCNISRVHTNPQDHP